MAFHRRILAALALLLLLGLPAQAGALFLCKPGGQVRGECCCKPPGPGQPAALRGECCCSQARWEAALAALSAGLHAVPVAARTAPAGRTPPLPAPHGPRWDCAARLPADPAPPDLYLTSCSLLI